MKAIFSHLEDTLNVFEGTRVTEDRTMMQSEWAVYALGWDQDFLLLLGLFQRGARGLLS